MTSTNKTLLGIASFLPFVAGMGFGVWYLMHIMQFMQQMIAVNGQPDPNVMAAHIFGMYGQMMVFFIPLLVLHLALMILFIMQAVKNRRISETERVVWILAFILTGSIAFPVYFFMRIYGRQNDPVALTDAITGMV